MAGMSDSARARPRQLTAVLWLVVLGSAFQVLSVFDRMSTLHSVDTRQEVAKVVGSGRGRDLGITVDEALRLMGVALTVSALCAAAAVVLGIFALQRHRGARIALSVVAVPLLATALLTGGMVGALVALAVAFTWTAPARDWFAGRPVRSGPDRSDRPPAAPPPPPDVPPAGPRPAPLSRPPSTDDTSDAPRPVHGFGQAPVHAPVLERPPARPVPAPAAPVTAVPPPVPASVRVACILTWLFAGVVALLYAILLVVLLADSQWIVDQVTASPAWTQAGLKQEMLLPVLWLGCLMFLAWSVSAIVLAFFTWRRHNWARYLLVVSAAAAIVAAFFAFPFGVPHQIAAAYVIGALFTPAAKRWFALTTRSWAPPPPGGKPPLW